MKQHDLRSIMKGNLQDATQEDVSIPSLLNKIMDDIHAHKNKGIENDIKRLARSMEQLVKLITQTIKDNG